MTDEDLAVIRRFAAALPEQAYGGRLLRVLAELDRRGAIEQRAREKQDGQRVAVEYQTARYILGEAS